jgi:hypothetical protein
LTARDHDARVFGENLEKSEGLFRQRDADAMLPQLTRAEVQLEVAKARPSCWVGGTRHGRAVG